MNLNEILKDTIEKMSLAEKKLVDEILKMGEEYSDYGINKIYVCTDETNQYAKKLSKKESFEKYHITLRLGKIEVGFKTIDGVSIDNRLIDQNRHFINPQAESTNWLPIYRDYLLLLQEYHDLMKSELEEKKNEIKEILNQDGLKKILEEYAIKKDTDKN